MAVRLSNPFYTRSPGGSGSLQGGGAINVGAPVDPLGGGIGSGIAGLIANTVGAATYDEERDPRAQAAKKYQAETAALNDQAAGRSTLGGLFSSLDMSPEGIKAGVQQMSAAAARAGIKPDQISELFRFMVSNTPGTSNDQVTRSVVGAGGAALGEDQSYTVGGQESIRRDNERQDINELTTKEGGLDSRNKATIRGAMERAVMEEGGRNERRFDPPVNAAAGTTTYFGPGDPRNSTGQAAPTTPGRPLTLPQLIAEKVQAGDMTIEEGTALSRKGETPNDVGANDAAGIAEMVDAGIAAEGVDVEGVDKMLRQQIRDRASELYQRSRNAQTSVSQAIREVAEVGDESTWGGLSSKRSLKPRSAAAPAATASAPAPESSLPLVTDPASYAAVPVGGKYRDPQGNVRTKRDGA